MTYFRCKEAEQDTIDSTQWIVTNRLNKIEIARQLRIGRFPIRIPLMHLAVLWDPISLRGFQWPSESNQIERSDYNRVIEVASSM